MTATKIVCTMGPATQAAGVIEELVAAGMSCARLNLSHGDHATHLATAERVRQAAMDAGRVVAIMADLQGPKIRVGKFEDGAVQLVAGQRFVLTGQPSPCNAERAWVSYEALAVDTRVGELILLDDGLLAMRVETIKDQDVVCVVETGGTLSDRKGVNLPGSQLSLPALTPKDVADLAFAVTELKADYVALSFVRRPEDVMAARALAPTMPIIAKLEKPEAVTNLEAIIDAADGIMVARGDLGVELGPEQVPMVQKRMIRAANLKCKPVITATQMLDSMIRNPRPTRAEAADVANAVLDGTDAVMLSGETASGVYPVAAVTMMRSLIAAAEAPLASEALAESRGEHSKGISKLPRISGEWELENAAARAAALLSSTLDLMAIVVVATDSHTADLLSAYRPHATILAITDDAAAGPRLALRWGVVPVVAPLPPNLRGSIDLAQSVLGQHFTNHEQGSYALVTGFPHGSKTNTVTLQSLSD